MPGIQVLATAAGAWGGQGLHLPGDGRELSDEAGRFTLTDVPVGKVMFRGMSRDWQNSEYVPLQAMRTISGAGTIDVGDIAVFKQRTKHGEPIGVLGVGFAAPEADEPADEPVFKVSWIDPAGPAARSELRVGDVITSIDGVALTDGGASRMTAPPGTRLALGTARGVTVTVVLAAP